MKFEKDIDRIRVLHPQFRSEIRGCSEEEIAALKKILRLMHGLASRAMNRHMDGQKA